MRPSHLGETAFSGICALRNFIASLMGAEYSSSSSQFSAAQRHLTTIQDLNSRSNLYWFVAISVEMDLVLELVLLELVVVLVLLELVLVLVQ